MKTLPKQYDAAEAEARLQKLWESSGVNAWRDDLPRSETYVIDTPPPTVSGVLHMGHIFSYTQADFMARYMRMIGKDVFYPMGFDDNGLPTERLVEKNVKKRAVDMPREEFIQLCQKVAKEYEDQFRDMFKSVALSVDWKQEYTTISKDSRRISQMSFLDLFKKGEVYRDFRPTYWDWVDQTAIAQAEIENKELPGVMNDLKFTLEGGEELVIMTTRPELLGACVAVMYHPEDPNAGKYAGKHAITPLFGVKVPMIADEAVEREKGTGLVMCCTFGDDTDKEWVRKYDLKTRPILSIEGKISVITFAGGSNKIMFRGSNGDSFTSGLHESNAVDLAKAASTFGAITGLKPKQANAKIIELLQASGELLKQTPMTHSVKCAERSGTPIEIIPTNQWFVKIVDKKAALTQKGNECKWHPEFMHIRLNQWIDGLKEDWCISRQRYSGVPFPVWYVWECEGQYVRGKPLDTIVAGAEMLPVDPLQEVPSRFEIIEKLNDGSFVCRIKSNHYSERAIHNGEELQYKENGLVILVPDKDIMDTWATSSVSPQLNSRGINKEFAVDYSRHQKLFPADLRPQAHEIIRTWAFYTIVKAHLHENSIPWKNLMISGWCLAADKTKMSKSKGNVVTPVDLIREKGADAVRYWASTSRLGADTAFSEDLLKIGRKLVTKLWNASQFVGTQIAGLDQFDLKLVTEPLDRWIISRLHATVAKATEQFAAYEYCDARIAVEEFFWKDFCDNYLELVKGRAYGETNSSSRGADIADAKSVSTGSHEILRSPSGSQDDGKLSAQVALYHCLDAVLRLFAPFVPHVTEEIYSYMFEDRGSIHQRGNWPKAANYFTDAAAEASGTACLSVLNSVRKAKSEKNVSIKFPIAKLVLSRGTATADWSVLEPIIGDLRNAGNIQNIEWSDAFPNLAMLTEDKVWGLSITFAEAAEVA